MLALVLLGSTNAFALKHSNAAHGNSSTFNVYYTVSGFHKGEDFFGQCNGSLIAEDLVVTSAHCLAGSTTVLHTGKVSVGNYIKKNYANGNTSNYYYRDLDVIGIKNVYFPKSVDQKIRTGTMTSVNSISANDDIALIELERPVDTSKVAVQYVNYVTPAEYQKIAQNISAYQFIALSTNMVTESTMDTKRYAPIGKMSLNGLLNQAYAVPMWSSDMYHQVEEGDSGAPLLVNVGREWKLFAVTKGTKRDSLSSYLELWTGEDINITPELNVFVPVTYQMCGLLKQARRKCR